ncbi:dTDP-glucose 4,6-dehydratase [Gemmatimonas sp.]
MTRSLLVTGGAGFIGANFVRYWCEHYDTDRVVVLDALTYAGDRARLADLEVRGAITFVHGDIGDGALVRTLLVQHAVTHVVHMAAESHVDRSIASPEAFVRTNVWGTHMLLEAVRSVWCQSGAWREGVRFHQVSTDEVFGALAPHDAPFTEASRYQPSSPYAASKAAADHFVRAAGRTYGLPFTISHCANNYGPYQYPEKLIPLMVRRALHGESLPLYGDGTQTREWLHVHDHSRQLAQLLLAPDIVGQSFNLGSRTERANAEVVQRICAHLDARFSERASLAARYPHCPAARGVSCASLVQHVADRPGHDRRYALDTTKYVERFGRTEIVGFEVGLGTTIDWYVGA